MEIGFRVAVQEGCAAYAVDVLQFGSVGIGSGSVAFREDVDGLLGFGGGGAILFGESAAQIYVTEAGLGAFFQAESIAAAQPPVEGASAAQGVLQQALPPQQPLAFGFQGVHTLGEHFV